MYKRRLILLVILGIIILLSSQYLEAQFNLLHSFGGSASDGREPMDSLILSDSTLFGMTKYGGAYDFGTIFKVNIDGTGYALLHSFSGNINDGKWPCGALTAIGSSLYGMTSQGGSGHGVIFKINPDGSGFELIHTFSSSASNGYYPYGSLIAIGTTMFGMTYYGGANGNGTIFKINADGTGFTLIHSFSGGGGDGSNPYGSLIIDGSTLYGMTLYGGTSNIGTVFKINKDGAGFQVLHSFSGGNADGRQPWGDLLLCGSTLFGTTYIGGLNNLGTIFKIKTDGTEFNLIHSFAGGLAGYYPYESLYAIGSTLYGTTLNGGNGGDWGTIFQINMDGTNFDILHSFSSSSTNGKKPHCSLQLYRTSFFGTTMSGGSSDYGTLFAFLLNRTIPSITVTSPNGGENWLSGSYENITWTASDEINNVKIEYSVDNGDSWITITESSENDGMYLWAIPSVVSSQCRIRISEALFCNPSDASDGNFSISPPPTIVVLSPNGGEKWEESSTHNITWSTTGIINYINIEYSVDGGENYQLVVSSFPNIGSFAWIIPNTPSALCSVRISQSAGGIPFDFSDASFEIVARPIISGTVRTTTGLGISGVTISFSDAGITTTDASGYYAKTLSYGWTGTATPSREGYTFSPTNRYYTNVTDGKTNEDYTGSIIFISISGKVSLAASSPGVVVLNTGLPGVIMNGLPGNPITDSSGAFIANVNYSWSGTVTPTKAGFAFSPVSRTYSSVTTAQVNQDFVALADALPRIWLSRRVLNFGFSGEKKTKPQKFWIDNIGGGILSWKINCNVGWISCIPTSGTDNSEVSVSIDASGFIEGIYSGNIEVSAVGADNSPQTLNVSLSVKQYSESPFGVVDTPVDGTTRIEGSVPVTGWALDDIEVTSVKIYRDLVGDELGGPNGLIYIGDAVFVEGARPDVEQAYPSYPMNYKAGWGYMMLTNFLPNSGNGTFRIIAIATDKEGNTTRLGTKTITCDNARATLPFGAIDTPSQGGTTSGNAYVNFAWVLTPGRKCIPSDGSTIWVWVDGQPLGHPSYGHYRVDIATLFPGYCNANGAVGYYYLDTTSYPNGVHTIAWSAVDSAGVGNGFGSRYFTIQNIGSGVQAEAIEAGLLKTRRFEKTLGLEKSPIYPWSPIFVRKGFNQEALEEAVYPDGAGKIRVEICELERVEIDLGEKVEGINWQSYLKVGAELRELPIGTTFDASKGILYWQPGPGFIGDYEFLFLSINEISETSQRLIHITIKPKM